MQIPLYPDMYLTENKMSYLGHAIGGKSALFGVFAHERLVRRIVDAVNLVVRHETFDPLNRRPQFRQHATRLLGHGLDLFVRELSGSGEFALYHVFWHKFRELNLQRNGRVP